MHEIRRICRSPCWNRRIGQLIKVTSVRKDETPPCRNMIFFAVKAHIEIPTLCYLRDVNAIGSCRVCAVEVEGRDELVPSCNTPVENDMKVLTSTDRVKEHRTTTLQLILADQGLNSRAIASPAPRMDRASCRQCAVRAGSRKRRILHPRKRFPSSMIIHSRGMTQGCAFPASVASAPATHWRAIIR